jgi:hypothetical protein
MIMDEPLGALRWHWGDAYAICHPAPDVWIAQRRDTRETLRATTPEGLRDLIIANYAANPVSRHAAPPAPRENPEGRDCPRLALDLSNAVSDTGCMPDAQPAGPGVSWRERHVPPRHAEV